MARRRLLETLDKLTPATRAAFEKGVQGLRDDFEWRAFKAAWDDGDLVGAFRAINLGAEYFDELAAVMASAFTQGGQEFFEEAGKVARRAGIEAIGRFSGRNPRAEILVKRVSSDLVTNIVSEQRDNIRSALQANMEEGVNAMKARDRIIGQSPGRGLPRRGGIVGLSEPQARYVQSVRSILSDKDRIREYFVMDRKTGKMKPRYSLTDRRMDARIRKAIRDGKALPVADVEKIAGRYSERLLRLRGQTIARTELLSTLHAAQDEGVKQLVESGKVRDDQVKRTWDAAEDKATRQAHRDADGQTASAYGTFTIGGYLMKHPGDRSGGAPAEQVINCRCRVAIDIDFIAGLGRGD